MQEYQIREKYLGEEIVIGRFQQKGDRDTAFQKYIVKDQKRNGFPREVEI